MICKNRYFYFGKADFDIVSSFPEGWEPGWYYRIRISEEEEEFKVEDTCGRMVPFMFYNVTEFINVLMKVQRELVVSTIGEFPNA